MSNKELSISKKEENLKYKEFLNQKLWFWENNLLQEFQVIKIKNGHFLLKREENNRIIEIETPVIEVLTLNFPEAQDYQFSKEQWKNFWLKYGGYLPENFNFEKEKLSIKEAREIFSQLPSRFEVNWMYYLFPTNDRQLSDFIVNKNFQGLTHYLEIIASFDFIKEFIFFHSLIDQKDNSDHNFQLSYEKEKNNSLKRYHFFGTIREIELFDEEERFKFLSESPSDIEDYLKRLFKNRELIIKINRDHYDYIKNLEERLRRAHLLIGVTSQAHWEEILNFEFYPVDIFLSDKINKQELKTFFKIFMLKYFFQHLIEDELFQQNSLDEKFFLSKLLTINQLKEILKKHPRFLILPTTNALPIVYFYKNLIKFTQIKLLKNKKYQEIGKKLTVPQIILFDFIDRYFWRNLLNEQINNQPLLAYFYELIKNNPLDDLEIKINYHNLNLSQENREKIKILIYYLQRVKKKISKYKELNKISSLSDLVNLLKEFYFIDDMPTNNFTYFASFYTLILSLFDIFRDRVNNFSDLEKALKEEFKFDINNPSLDLSIVENNERCFFTGRDIFKEFNLFFKVKKTDQNLTYTYYPGFYYEDLIKFLGEESHWLFEHLTQLTQRKMKILKIFSSYLSSFLAEMIINNPDII
jgi:hypothetical protein